jgi:hypothetical protein
MSEIETNTLTVAEASPEAEAHKLDAGDDRPAIGSWWWVKSDDDVEENADYDNDDDNQRARYDRGRGKSAQWLACVVEVGSNYAKLQGVYYSLRIALDDMPERCQSEFNPQAFIDAKIAAHRNKVKQLMGEIQRVCHQLGVPFRQALAETEAPSTALAVAHGVDNVKTYQTSLVKAKDKTLPELFEKVKAQHARMATWMKAELIPAEAELTMAKDVTKVIEQKIHTVELYAGLQEDLVQVCKGDPAPVETKVHIMQRRCYMDEECLARYEAGGMDFENVGEFDKWLSRDENMTRILPHERCIVAMRIRRHDKQYGGEKDTLSNFIRFSFYNRYNKSTFLYIRNGRQLWRMSTSIEFDHSLFPRREDVDMLGDDELWVKPSHHKPDFITGRQRAAMVQYWKSRRSFHARMLWAWHQAGKPGYRHVGKDEEEQSDDAWTYIAQPGDDDHWSTWTPGSHHRQNGRPWEPHESRDAEWKRYRLVTPEDIYYDDAMKHVAQVSFEHNRIAVIVQGLLDRSTCLHPHPPWRIWTQEGFAAGIELVYDVSLAMTPGAAPNWEGYRTQLNKSLRVGAIVIGQRSAWAEAMEEEYGEKWRYYGSKCGDGPKTIDEIKALRSGKARFDFTRDRARSKFKWVPADRPGYIRKEHDDSPIAMAWWCPLEHLTCIDAYTPGDYRIFFDDPRTRADYLEWAPILLAAEDWHAERRAASDERPKAKRRKS